MLGPYRKYSCCLFPKHDTKLEEAEKLMLSNFIYEHLDLPSLVKNKEGDQLAVLDLGCGWGSHGKYILDNFKDVNVTFLSNSETQQNFIRSRVAHHTGRFFNIKCDASEFDSSDL